MTSIEELYKHYLNHPNVFTDTRKPVRGGIYFALSGPNFNGNLFAMQALDSGAAFAVVDEFPEKYDERILQVPDVLKSLQDLALFHRKQLPCKVIGITGSNGKTTTKELLAAVLSRKYRTSFTQGNLNNHIGVPLTLLSIKTDTELAVVEMGASKPGDIRELCEIAAPDFGLITNIGKAHLEGMGGYEGVVKTKTELYFFIKQHKGSLFVNVDHPVFKESSAGVASFRYGTSPECDIQGEYLSSDPFVHFRWVSPSSGIKVNERQVVATRLMGYYNFENILAAVAVGHYFGIPDEAINEAISSYIPENNRSQIVDTGRNRLIMDAYNANPTSMEAALNNFSKIESPRKMVILGKMMELGETSSLEHRRIAFMAAGLNQTKVILIGDLYTEIPEGAAHFRETEAASTWLKSNHMEGYTILIKGSRANQLEKLRDQL
jgi:UDP-N-acetylmuramoyl-tripeptide--D-alanyl-D-alanine ligase